MNILDERLRKHYDRTISVITGFPDDEVPVCALMDAWFWFQLIEGENSVAATEALELLLTAELRPAVRKWYRRSGDGMNPHAMKFRDELSKQAGEVF